MLDMGAADLFMLDRSPVIFAIPRPLRLTNMGLRKVPPDQVTAALPTIIAGS
jgi:ABC-type proline/glycine betaine transport system permease subunit